MEKFISPSRSISCEGFLSSEELLNSVRGINTGKSPGSDGLSVDILFTFWEPLDPLLLCVANRRYADDEFCPSIKGSVISLIFKKRGDIKP